MCSELTCPLSRLISLFLLVADPAMLCGEKAVISTILLLVTGSPVAWASTVRWMKDYRLLRRRRVNLLVHWSKTDYGTLWLVRGAVGGRPR